jgi:hypothetical protein
MTLSSGPIPSMAPRMPDRVCTGGSSPMPNGAIASSDRSDSSPS